jgi:hypothetical protein
VLSLRRRSYSDRRGARLGNTFDPNERFKNVEAIKLAMEEASAETVPKTRQAYTKPASTPEIASHDTVFDFMCTHWQI